MVKIGDNVLSLKQPNGLICTILTIQTDYFVLAPMTSRGFPSTNQQKWEYYKVELLEKLVLAKKYPHTLICPDCKVEEWSKILNAPLRRISAYNNQYQCKKCKEVFIYKKGVDKVNAP